MSRTKRGSKGSEWETWSKRPGSCFPAGKIGKQITTGKERMKAKEDLILETKEVIITLSNEDFDSFIEILNDEPSYEIKKVKEKLSKLEKPEEDGQP